MTRLHEQTAFIRLEPLTPIHIGTGETMDPLSYIMKEEGGNPFLYSVDVPSWVEAHPDPAGLAGLFFAEKDREELEALGTDPETLKRMRLAISYALYRMRTE